MHATDTAAELAWPALHPSAAAPLEVTGIALDVCAELERRLRLLDNFRLPRQIAQDVDEMARDLDELQSLLSTGPAVAPKPGKLHAPGRADRLLADLRAWLPVCEAWIGVAGPGLRAWPPLLS